MKKLMIFWSIVCVGFLIAPAAVIGKEAMPEFNVNVLNTSLPVDLTSTSPLDVTITNELHVPVTVATYQFVGFTAGVTNGQVAGGIAGMNGLCQESFASSTARMATTKEYRETPYATTPTNGEAWVIPDIRVIFTTLEGRFVTLESGDFVYAEDGLNCSGWTDRGNYRSGVMITRYGKITDGHCGGLNYVTCSDLESQ